MSKTSLKKELEGFDRSQLVELILNAYSANKVIKDYFEFFVAPDVDRLTDKYERELIKEIYRGKYNQSTARISRIRKMLKDYESFNPGPESVRDLRIKVISMLIERESVKNYSDTLINGTLRLADDTLAYADKNAIFDTTVAKINDLIAPANDRTRHFRNFLRKNLCEGGKL